MKCLQGTFHKAKSSEHVFLYIQHPTQSTGFYKILWNFLHLYSITCWVQKPMTRHYMSWKCCRGTCICRDVYVWYIGPVETTTGVFTVDSLPLRVILCVIYRCHGERVQHTFLNPDRHVSVNHWHYSNVCMAAMFISSAECLYVSTTSIRKVCTCLILHVTVWLGL